MCVGSRCLFEHANTRKHVYEHGFLSLRVSFNILAHLAQYFFLFYIGQMNRCF